MGADLETRPGALDPVQALVIAVIERLAAGDARALDEVCDAHPELAAEIRRRVDALGELNLLPGASGGSAFPERLGEFRLLRRLGGGGMGVVYEALQEPLGRVVALKLIRPEHLYFERSRERFRRETEAVARLAHPGIVGIFTVGEAQGTPYFAMEMIRGASLAQILEQVAGIAPESLVGADLLAAIHGAARGDDGEPAERTPELFAGTWAEASARVIVRMAEALAHAHARGVLHRDIKPSNIAVTPAGRVVLLDFGLAGLEHELRLTVSGSALGSVPYMAPEQLAGRTHEIDARTDVYALGVTLYELLTLQAPFMGADSEQTRAAVLDGQPQSIRARHRGVPRDLEIVCLKAMERDRARRYASMDAFRADLENVLAGRPIQARPPSAAYRARRWMARHPAAATAVASIVLLVTVLPTALYLQQRANNRALQESLIAESRARDLATEKAREAEEVASFLVALFAASDPYQSGRRDVTAREILDEGVQRVERDLAGQPELQALLLERIGESFTNLDLYAQALVPLDRALELRRAAYGDDDSRTAATMVLVASAARLAGRAGVTDLLRRANAVLERDPAIELAVMVNARTLLAASLLDDGDARTPLELLADARGRLDAAERAPIDLQWLVITMLASVRERSGDHFDAEAAAREALALDPLPGSDANPWRLAALDTLGLALHGQGRLGEARAVFDSLLPDARAFYGADNVVVAQMEINRAEVRSALGEAEGVSDDFESAYATLRRGLGVEHRKAIGALARVADAWMLEGRVESAEALLLDALTELRERQADAGPSVTPVLFRLAQCSLARGDRDDAESWLWRARDASASAGPEDRAALDVMLARTLVAGSSRLGEAAELARSGVGSAVRSTRSMARFVLASVAAAEERLDDAERELRAVLAEHPSHRIWPESACEALLGDLLVRRGDAGEGCERLRAGLGELERSLGPAHFEVLDARARADRSGASAECGFDVGRSDPTVHDDR